MQEKLQQTNMTSAEMETVIITNQDDQDMTEWHRKHCSTMKAAAETPSHSKHGEIPKTDCTAAAVTWKLGKSVDSIEEEELEKSDANPSEESNNNDGGGDSRQLQRTSSNCVRSHATVIFRKQ